MKRTTARAAWTAGPLIDRTRPNPRRNSLPGCAFGREQCAGSSAAGNRSRTFAGPLPRQDSSLLPRRKESP